MGEVDRKPITVNPEADEELVVEYRQIEDVLRIVLHTIIFNRALGALSPHDVPVRLQRWKRAAECGIQPTTCIE
jgi:hypothetical protein